MLSALLLQDAMASHLTGSSAAVSWPAHRHRLLHRPQRRQARLKLVEEMKMFLHYYKRLFSIAGNIKIRNSSLQARKTVKFKDRKRGRVLIPLPIGWGF
jgi:hypothetical protein